MPVELWFPTPIYYYQFTDNILKTIQDEIVRYVPDLEDTLTSPWDDSVLTTFKYVDNINFLDNKLNLDNNMSESAINRLRKTKEDLKLQTQQNNRKKENLEINKKKKENGFDSNRTLISPEKEAATSRSTPSTSGVNKENNNGNKECVNGKNDTIAA